jgi:hypothetical protein
MPLRWKVGIPLLLVITIIVTTPFFGRAETKQFSAYAVCRKAALDTKGYALWEHEGTDQQMFTSWVIFFDGYNHLSCQAVGIGPFWTVKRSMHTLVGCAEVPEDGKIIMKSTCPEDYFGVSP